MSEQRGRNGREGNLDRGGGRRRTARSRTPLGGQAGDARRRGLGEATAVARRELEQLYAEAKEERSAALSTGEAPPGAGRLIVRSDRLAVELARVTAVTVHLEEGLEAADADGLARDLLALSALALERFGQLRAAGLLALTYLPSSTLLTQPDGVWALSSAMAASRQVREALDLAEELDQADDHATRELSLLFMLVPLHHAPTLSSGENHAYREAMERRVERRGESTDAARETMNLAQFELVSGDPAEAAKLHQRVVELDPTYETRLHYLQERAGALFLAAHQVESMPRGGDDDPGPPEQMWQQAVEAYEALEAISEDPRDQALLADALIFAGHYQAALDLLMVFNQELQDPQPRDDEWLLKEMLLRGIVEERGITRQERQPLNVGQHEEVTGADELEELLARDALAPMIWFNLGVTYAGQKQPEKAAPAYTAAGLLTGWDAPAWAHSFLFFFEAEAWNVLPPLLTTGQRMTGGQMVPAITELVDGQGPEFPRAEFMKGLRLLIDDLPKDPGGGTQVRMLRENGDIESVTLPEAGRRVEPTDAPGEHEAPTQRRPGPKIGRNDPCPCGSGRKYKKCHGAS